MAGLAAAASGTSARAAISGSATSSVRVLAGTPADDGFQFPAEWAPHERTIMMFPPAGTWRGGDLREAKRAWARVANVVARFEPVLMVVHPGEDGPARHLLDGSIEIVALPIDDAWSRDSGPMIVVNKAGERRVAGFTFNGWGERFPHAHDALAKARLARHLDLPIYESPVVLEGGAVTVDGEGTVITTEQCLLNMNRNPGLGKADVEAVLHAFLGVETVIWLKDGIVPDPITDGHVDGICAFAAPGLVLLHTTEDTNDPNHAICSAALERLRRARDARGRRLEIVQVPLAWDVAHMNFYLANGAVVVPTADDPRQDDAPLAVLREVFADRDVVGVSGRLLAEGGGGVHCITQQVPAV